MSEIGWGQLKPASARAATMDAVLLFQRAKCGADLPPVRDQPADILSLEAGLRPSRSAHPGRALASSAQRAPAQLGTRVSRTGVVSASAVIRVGVRTSWWCWPRELPRLHLHGGTPDSGLLEAARVLHEPPKPALLPG